MRNKYKKHNHNRKGQFTDPEKTRYLAKHCIIADYVKIINDTTGLFDRLTDPALDRLDKRVKNIEYSFHFILVVCTLSCCIGISAASAMSSTFIEPCALKNISLLAHEPTTRAIDYQAIDSAISRMDDVSWIEGLAQDICEKMWRSGRYKKYGKWYGAVVVLDATDYAFFRSPHCDHDLTATFHNGTRDQKTYYFHKALEARLFLTKSVSFPIGVEFIENKEKNPNKQDCENDAAIRLLKRLKERFPLMTFIICGDALYANRTFIRLCVEYHWNYLFTLKEGCQPSLCHEFTSMVQNGLTGHVRVRYDGEETGTVYWANDMGLIVNNPLPMNILRYQTKITVTKGDKKPRGIQNVSLRRKDFVPDMPELSKDQSNYDLDGRKAIKNARTLKEDAARKEEKSEKGKEKLKTINEELVEVVGDALVSSDEVKVGDSIDVSFMYITNLPISKANVGDLLVRGRMRWMIEECFLREKVGAQQLEHLKSKDPMTMKFYFWMEIIADSCMEIYLDYSNTLKVYGSEEEVYSKLRASFENKILKENYDDGRECHRHYSDERNNYPTVEILPDEDSDKNGHPQKEQAKGTGNHESEKKSLKNLSKSGQKSTAAKATVVNPTSSQSDGKNDTSGGRDIRREEESTEKKPPTDSPAHEIDQESIPNKTPVESVPFEQAKEDTVDRSREAAIADIKTGECSQTCIKLLPEAVQAIDDPRCKAGLAISGQLVEETVCRYRPSEEGTKITGDNDQPVYDIRRVDEGIEPSSGPNGSKLAEIELKPGQKAPKVNKVSSPDDGQTCSLRSGRAEESTGREDSFPSGDSALSESGAQQGGGSWSRLWPTRTLALR